jgi:AmmeMemoRadiSam system protein A
MLSDSDKHVLLQIARQSIEAAVNDNAPPNTVISQPVLREQRGAFVTLHEHNELRGCIGYVDPVKALWETVQDAAAKAALEDPRFMSVQRDELQHIEIEISVLSPLHEVTSIDEIEIGLHGLVVEFKDHRALLLPQVAVSTGWDKETFLQQTLRKSGLPPQMRDHKDLKIFSFTAEVFSEVAVSQP